MLRLRRSKRYQLCYFSKHTDSEILELLSVIFQWTWTIRNIFILVSSFHRLISQNHAQVLKNLDNDSAPCEDVKWQTNEVTVVQKWLSFIDVRLDPPGHCWLYYILSDMRSVGLWIEMCSPVHGLIWPALVRILEEGEGPGPGVGAWWGVRSRLLSNSSSRTMSGHRVWALWGGATGRTVPRWHVQTGPGFRGRQCRARILRSAARMWLEILGFLTQKIFVVCPKSVFGPFPLLLPLGSAVLKPNLEQKENKWK